MDDLPRPDYSDYFAVLERFGETAVLGDTHPMLVFETSRGCWWGEKHHCTFCGLNAMTMTYRSKSPDRVLDELAVLTDRYRMTQLFAVDNILDMRYLSTVCERLAEKRWDLQFFYEVKANLSRDQLGTLKRAGVNRVQPGVESLSSHVLALMRKGATMLTNVRLLKWAGYHDIQASWNILYGFPGESDSDYEQQMDLIPSLLHLRPPLSCGELWLERFAPYFTEDFPIHDVRPAEAYRHIYPAGVDLDRIAYYFDYRAEQVASGDVRERLKKVVAAWRDRWAEGRPPVLTYQRGRDWLSILDTRGERPRRLSMSGWRAAAYLACDDKPHTARRVRESLADVAPSLTDEQVTEFLDACVAKRLAVREDGKYLSLALPRNPNW
jgi:ribosomal peptide maturation radical SAM protein 1